MPNRFIPHSMRNPLPRPVLMPHPIWLASIHAANPGSFSADLEHVLRLPPGPRKTHQLWTDASGQGYGAVLDPAADGKNALDASFISRAEALSHGCRGVLPPEDPYMHLHEAYSLLLYLDRSKERLRGTHICTHIDARGTVVAIQKYLDHARQHAMQTCLCVGAKVAVQNCEKMQAPIRDWAEVSGKMTCKGSNFSLALTHLLREYDIELEVVWTSRKNNRMADRLSKAATEGKRRALPEGIRRRLNEGV